MNMNKYERLNQQKKYSSEKSFSGKKVLSLNSFVNAMMLTPC